MGYQTVTQASLRSTIYNSIFTLLNTYKPTGWTVVSSFPEKDPVFPCYVVNPANITIKFQGMGKSIKITEAEILIEVFSKVADRMSVLDTGIDKLHEIFTTYESTLRGYRILLSDESPLTDSETSRVDFGGQELNTSAVAVALQISL